MVNSAGAVKIRSNSRRKDCSNSCRLAIASGAEQVKKWSGVSMVVLHLGHKGVFSLPCMSLF